MGLSTKKTKTTQTTTPTVTEPYNTAFQDFTGQIGDFLAMDPTQFVAPTSELQNQAFQQAQNLGGWEPYLNQASSYANQFANAPASQVTPYGYQAPEVPNPFAFGGAQLSQPWSYSGAQLGDASMAQGAQLGQAATYGGATLGSAAQMSATGYNAPTINGVAGPQAYGAQRTTLGGAPMVNLGGYNLPELGDAAMADPTRLREYMADYQNPYTQQVIDASLAKFDEDAGRREAALSAQGAIGGAFGGSRFGIAEGTLEGSLARERADMQARLYDEQFKTAASLAGVDASAANQFALANQNAQNQYGLAEYGAGIDAARYGAEAGNQGQLANQGMLANYAMQQFGADTQSAQQFANALNNASLAGYQGDLQTALTQAGLDAESSRYFADAMNQAGVTNMNALNQFMMQQGAFEQQAGLSSMDAINQFAMAQGGFDQQTALANQDALNNFAMQQGLLDQQTGQFNADALNNFAMQQGLLDQQTGAMNMEALNNFLITQVGLDADSSRYYADALNQASFANANLLEQSYMRDLQAAGLFGDLGQTYGQQSLADLGMTANLGEMQRGIESEYLNAYPTQLQLAGGLYSQLYPGLYSGSNMVGTGKEGGLGSWLPQVAGSAMQAAAIGFSDRRLKSNIAKVGEMEDGLGIYDYDIFGKRDRGVMADEVAELRPWAVGPVINGFATVDYSRI